MAAKKSAESSPLTFDLKADLIAVLEKYQKQLGVSKSEIIRYAISGFDYAGFAPAVEPHRQISVRLPLNHKKELVKLAKTKKVSIGELLRAVAAYAAGGLEALQALSSRQAGGAQKLLAQLT